MRVRSLVAASIFLAMGVAHADPKGDIEKKIKTAMESYDMMDYDAAKKTLNQAIAAAKKAKLDKDAVAAKAYLDLGIVAFVNNDQDGAKLSFSAAVQIQPKIQIDPAYKSPEMAKLLEEVRGEAKGGGGGGAVEAKAPPAGGGDGGPDLAADLASSDCSSIKGLDHTLVETGRTNAPLPIEAKLGSDVKASKVSLMFRAEGAADYIEVKMKKDGCKYTASIPASGTKGVVVHYYVAAYGEGPKPIASKGSAGSPNIVELSGGGPAPKGGGDDEDPINGGKAKPTQVAQKPEGGDVDSGGEVSKGTEVGTKTPHIMLAFAGGPGFGYLSGTTEGMNPVKSSGFGPSWVVLQPEIGYMVSPKLTIGVAARLGMPIGANVDGHATLAPAGLARVRYALSPDGEGLHVMGQLGAGIIRSTLTLDNAMPGQNTDIVASGPLLIGGGAGFKKQLSGSVMFLADLSVLAAVNITGNDAMGNSSVTGAPLNSGLTVDLSIGLALGL